MHSMLASLSSEPHQPMQALQQQQPPASGPAPHQHQLLPVGPALEQHQASEPQQQHHQQPSSTMTVLETLAPSLRGVDPQQMSIMADQSQQQQQQQQLLGGAQQMMQQQQPHLHQLQPSHSSSAPAPNQQTLEENSGADDQQVAAASAHQLVEQQGRHLLRQRSAQQIEGIVADGGGPIVQWLLDNYEIAEGESLPRSTVYNHYLAHCRQLQMASVNAASFGKLIRSVFVGLKTRRLGTRGHSKYHYFGVRAKQHAEQEILQFQLAEGAAGCSRDNNHNDNSNNNTDQGTDSDSTANECGRHSSGSSTKRVKRNTAGPTSRRPLYQQEEQQEQQAYSSSEAHQPDQHTVDRYYNVNGYHQTGPKPDAPNNNHHHQQLSSSSADQQHQNSSEQLVDFRNYLGANWQTLVDEHWPQREPCALENELTKVTGSTELASCLGVFETKYRWAYKHMMELLSQLKFMQVEQMWYDFWHLNQPPQQNHWAPQASAEDPTVAAQQQQQEKQQQLVSEIHHHQPPSSQQQQQQHVEYQQQHPHETDPHNMQQHILHHHHHQQQQLHLYHHQQQQQHPQQHQQQQPQQQQQQQQELTFEQLYQLTSQPSVIARINQIDYHLYEAIGSFLLPDMLSPIPFALAQQIRQFAMNIGPSSEKATKDYDPRFAAEKSKSGWAFGSALRRYTCLNHLSTASRAIWEKRSALAQMSLDLTRVDLRDIEHQASLMSRKQHPDSSTDQMQQHPAQQQQQQQASSVQQQQQQQLIAHEVPQATGSGQEENNKTEPGVALLDQHRHHYPSCAMQPAQLIQNFLHLLEDPYPANSWPDWCRNLVESRVCGLSMEEARSFVLKWNFYITLIMKELTLRSADSFSSFQLIRMLFDEYIFYLVVSRLAQTQHKTPCQLLSQLSSQLS